MLRIVLKTFTDADSALYELILTTNLTPNSCRKIQLEDGIISDDVKPSPGGVGVYSDDTQLTLSNARLSRTSQYLQGYNAVSEKSTIFQASTGFALFAESVSPKTHWIFPDKKEYKLVDGQLVNGTRQINCMPKAAQIQDFWPISAEHAIVLYTEDNTVSILAITLESFEALWSFQPEIPSIRSEVMYVEKL